MIETADSRRFARVELDAFARLHESLEKSLEASFSAVLKTEVLVGFRGAGQVRFKDFLTLNSFILAAMPVTSGADAVQDWPPIFINFPETVISPMLNRLLGAEMSAGPRRDEARKKLTTLEEKLLERILSGVYAALAEAWRPVMPAVTFRGTPLEAVPFAASYVTLDFGISLFGISGVVGFAFPSSTAAGLLSLMELETETAAGNVLTNCRDKACLVSTSASFPAAVPEPDASAEIAGALRRSLVEVRVQLPGGKVVPRELLEWKLGDIIHLNRGTDAEFGVLVEGAETFRAKPGKFQKRKVIEITGKRE